MTEKFKITEKEQRIIDQMVDDIEKAKSDTDKYNAIARYEKFLNTIDMRAGIAFRIYQMGG